MEPEQSKEDSDHKYLYKYDPKRRGVARNTTTVGETQEARRALEGEADTNSEIETRLVTGIKTPLDIISITL